VQQNYYLRLQLVPLWVTIVLLETSSVLPNQSVFCVEVYTVDCNVLMVQALSEKVMPRFVVPKKFLRSSIIDNLSLATHLNNLTVT
jgi:hypothetical protein